MFANALLVRGKYGWFERLDSGSISTFGRYEALLSIGDTGQPFSTTEVYQVADAQLATYAQLQREIAASVEPVTDADKAYLSFEVGNNVTIPDESGFPSSERVLGITVTEDDAVGIAHVDLSLRQIIPSSEERVAQLVRKSPVWFPEVAQFTHNALAGIGGGSSFIAGGSTWFTGTGAPDDATGSDGDFYVDTATQLVYTKGGGTWA